MKSGLKVVLLFLPLVSSFSDEPKNTTPPPPPIEGYLQIYSTKTQTPNLITGSYIFSDPIPPQYVKNFEVSPQYDKIICKQSGIYLMCIGVQPAILSSGIGGYVNCWYELNGKPVAGSNSRQYVNQDSPISIVTNIFLIPLNQGDSVGVKFSASGPNIGVIAINNPFPGIPAVFSYGLTILKIY